MDNKFKKLQDHLLDFHTEGAAKPVTEELLKKLQDPSLDFHTEGAAKHFGIKPKHVTEEQRAWYKQNKSMGSTHSLGDYKDSGRKS
jgi:CHAD domain-containing protein